MKSVLKVVIGVMVFVYRVSKGRFGGKMGTMNVLLLTTTGRKTGKQRTVPLGYLLDKGDYVIIASNAGLDKNPAWYINLQANPTADLQVNERSFRATAQTADPDTRKRLWAQLIQVAPNYAKYETMTSRDIPIVILHPAN